MCGDDAETCRSYSMLSQHDECDRPQVSRHRQTDVHGKAPSANIHHAFEICHSNRRRLALSFIAGWAASPPSRLLPCAP